MEATHRSDSRVIELAMFLKRIGSCLLEFHVFNNFSEMRGIMDNAFEDIFSHIKQSQSSDNFLVRASYLEIHNEEVKDLLAGQTSCARLDLKENSEGGVYVKNLTSVTVQCISDIKRLLAVLALFPSLFLLKYYFLSMVASFLEIPVDQLLNGQGKNNSGSQKETSSAPSNL